MTSVWGEKEVLGLEEAEIIALRALAFLGAEESRIRRFLSLTGLTPGDLQAGAQTRTPHMLAAILEYLLGDEPLLLVFAAETGIDPERITPSFDRLQSGSQGPE